MKEIQIKKSKDASPDWESILSQLKGCFSLLPYGEYVLTFSKKKTRRSVPQNSLMWLWFSCIAEETGHTKDEVHDYYCSKFLRHTLEWTYGEESWVTTTTHSLNTDQFKEFLTQVQADAQTTLGIELPNPDDYNFNEFYNYYINKL